MSPIKGIEVTASPTLEKVMIEDPIIKLAITILIDIRAEDRSKDCERRSSSSLLIFKLSDPSSADLSKRRI
jgi:hypothetical protein